MPTDSTPRGAFSRRFLLLSLSIGLIAGCLFPPIANLLVGKAALRWPFIVSCLLMGLAVGAILHRLVLFMLTRQIHRHLELLRGLGTAIRIGDDSIEGLEEGLRSSVAQTSQLLDGMAGAIAQFVPHYQALAEASGHLTGKTEEGFSAALVARGHIEAVEAKQQEIAGQMERLSHRTQDEAALARELSASLEEMALAMERSNARFLETTSTVDEMASSIREVASESERISRTVEQTARDLDSIGESLEKIRRDAESGASAAQAVKVDAENGLNVVEASAADMALIASESQQAMSAMERLERRTEEVGKIISVIRELVSDTELLAFNAAIIAAQAGAEGRGFSVVAEEIRDLADRTSSSAQEIQKIVHAIAADTGEVNKAVAATGERIAAGRRQSLAAGEALRKIVASSEQSAATSGEIARITSDQGERSRTLLEGAGQGLRSVKTIAKAIQEQQVAIGRIQQGVTAMKEASDQIAHGMEEQLRAKRDLDRGIEERIGQITTVDRSLQFQAATAQQVFAHFAASELRLKGNAERAGVINRELAELETLTGKLRALAASFSQPHPR